MFIYFKRERKITHMGEGCRESKREQETERLLGGRQEAGT